MPETEQTIDHTTGFYPVNPDTATLWRQLSTGDLYVDMKNSTEQKGMVRVYVESEPYEFCRGFTGLKIK